MSFRAKLLLVYAVAIGAAVALVAWGVTRYTRREFEQLDQQRTEALVAQFRREFTQRSDGVVRRVQGIADAEATVRMAIDLARPQADPSIYFNDGRGLARSYQLDFVDLAGNDGTLISSAEWPARFGYKVDWLSGEKNWNTEGAFLHQVELLDNVELGLMAVRVVKVGDKGLYVVGGERLDKGFLSSLVLPAGVRALLYSNLEPGFVASALTDTAGPVSQADRFAPLILEEQKQPRDIVQTIQWTSDAASAETFHALPLTGRNRELLGVLLVGSSRRELVFLT